MEYLELGGNMLREVIAFANFEFSLGAVMSKVLAGERIHIEERKLINWREYQNHLESLGLDDDWDERGFWRRYLLPRADSSIFEELRCFQNEIIELLNSIAERQVIPSQYWQKIFRECDGLPVFIKPKEAEPADYGPDDLQGLSFRYSFQADTYRAFMMALLRQLIIGGRVFAIGKNEKGFFADDEKPGPAPSPDPATVLPAPAGNFSPAGATLEEGASPPRAAEVVNPGLTPAREINDAPDDAPDQAPKTAGRAASEAEAALTAPELAQPFLAEPASGASIDEKPGLAAGPNPAIALSASAGNFRPAGAALEEGASPPGAAEVVNPGLTPAREINDAPDQAKTAGRAASEAEAALTAPELAPPLVAEPASGASIWEFPADPEVLPGPGPGQDDFPAAPRLEPIIEVQFQALDQDDNHSLAGHRPPEAEIKRAGLKKPNWLRIPIEYIVDNLDRLKNMKNG